MSNVYRLYGIELISNARLFTQGNDYHETSLNPDNALHLVEHVGSTNLLLNHFPLYPTHARNLSLYSDGELAASQQGQCWQFEVHGVVRFDWTGGSKGEASSISDNGGSGWLGN